MFISLKPDQADVIRAKLLQTLGTETDRSVRNKISDAVAEVARQYAETSTLRQPPVRRPWPSLTSADTSWTDLLQALFELSMSPDAEKREVAFRIFSTTPGIIEQHGDTVATAFARGFKDDSVAVCRTCSLDAYQQR